MYIFQSSTSRRKIYGEGSEMEARMYQWYLYYSRHNAEGSWNIKKSEHVYGVSPVDLNSELIKILKGEVER